jgi:Zn-dependent peptidase ImmA (M78 family)
MSSIRVQLNRSILSWALERAPADLTAKFRQLNKWLSGEVQPTLRQLEAFAKAAAVPLGYFFLDAPPAESIPIPHFRTLPNAADQPASADLLETVWVMEQRQSWMREYLVERGDKPLAFVGSASVHDAPAQVAQEIRRTLGMDANWAAGQRTWSEALRALRTRAESVGILVVISSIVGNNARRKLSVDEFRGFVLVDEYAPLVFINGADGKAAQMFTLAHELAHVWLGRSAAFDLRALQPARDEIEEACNRIAAEFLVPTTAFMEVWPRVEADADRFQKLARYFKVSEIVAARRALDLKVIARDAFLRFYEAYRAQQRAKRPGARGGNFFATQNLRLSRRFGEAVARAVQEGLLTYREAYRLTGLRGAAFDKYVAHLLGGYE